MGENQDGIIFRLCRELIESLNNDQESSSESLMTVSYMEIYNEKVYDLLLGNHGHASRIRDLPQKGAYVEGLVERQVKEFKDFISALEDGNNNRVVASTLLNSCSSRSHAIFSITLTQSVVKQNNQHTLKRNSRKICLADLAGSERASLTGVSGVRLTEANFINKSLCTLGDVINGLCERSQGSTSFIPYRNSVLTWLLKGKWSRG